MSTTNIVAILLFILPGILAEKISYRMDYPSSESRSDFREIINGIFLSLPIILITGLAAWKINNFNTLKELIQNFDDLQFLFTFAISIFLLAIIFGIAKGLTSGHFISIVNFIRKTFDKMKIDNKSCWTKTFLDRNVPGYVKIIKDDKIIQEGFVDSYSLPNEEKEIVFYYPPNIEEYPEYKDYIKLFKTYVNIEKGVIIEVYDTKEFLDYACTKEE